MCVMFLSIRMGTMINFNADYRRNQALGTKSAKVSICKWSNQIARKFNFSPLFW